MFFVVWMRGFEVDPAVVRLFRRRGLKDSTRENYLKGVVIFCGFVGGSPSEVVEKVRGTVSYTHLTLPTN